MLESKSKVLTSTLKSRYFRHESNVVHGPDTAEGEKVKMQNEQISLFRVAIVAGFEPARAMPIGFQVQRLNHSAILPEKNCCPDRTGDPKIKKKRIVFASDGVRTRAAVPSQKFLRLPP